jgi:hypothetical protein
MTRPITRAATLLAVTIAAWQPSSALAAEEDTQFWLLGFARGNLDEDVFVIVDTSLRLREPQIGPDQQTIRVTIEQGFAENRGRIGGGFAVFETNGQTEFRPHQQLRYVRGPWDLRTRFEQRLFPGEDRAELRIRQRVQYTHEASEKVELIGSVKWFGIVQARNARRDPDGTEQVRFLVAAAVDVGGGVEIQPGYLLWYSPRAARPDGISHVPQVAVNYRF